MDWNDYVDLHVRISREFGLPDSEIPDLIKYIQNTHSPRLEQILKDMPSRQVAYGIVYGLKKMNDQITKGDQS